MPRHFYGQLSHIFDVIEARDLWRFRILRAPSGPEALEVLRELSLGHDNDAVATALRMSPNTVRTHVQNILSKLKVHSKLEAVSRGIRERWIRIPQEPAA